MSQVTLLGIRHHGPGSTRNVFSALQSIHPDCILIELPEQCTPRLKDVAQSDLVPPVALLFYNTKDLKEASFYPFAEFSPEWQAMQYAQKHQIEARAIDLPFLFAPTANSSSTPSLFQPVTGTAVSEALVADPFDAIAKLDGFSDCERWWESRIERQEADVEATFQTIAELMTALRQAKSSAESDETLLREAHMRQGIRQAQKDGFQKIAVVCGAWHVPALGGMIGRHTTSQDAALLKNKRKVKTETTWIPWSFERLTIARGYAAGVRTPIWYRYLHQYGAQNAMAYWVAEVCRHLRSSDLSASSAHAIETVRLAQTLSTIRGTAIPGIDELTEAVISVLCNGYESTFASIRQLMLTGDVIGLVPSKLNQSPLRADFEARLSSAHMKLTSTPTKAELDMRNTTHVKKSILIHQLLLLGIDWGVAQQKESKLRLGGFHEDWVLQWQPEFELRWLELSALGATIEQATQAAVLQRTTEIQTLTELVQLLSSVMKSDLLALIPALSNRLKELSAGTSDTFTLADAALPLAEMQRYGSARAFDFTQLQPILDDIITRACIQIVVACVGIDEEIDAEAAKTITKLNRAIHLPGQETHKPQWLLALHGLAKQANTSPVCHGLAHRLLFDQSALSIEQVSIALQSMTSNGQEPYAAALWLDGFLQGNALLILHYPPFFKVLKHWIQAIHEEAFEQALPILRRAFSTFSGPERTQIMRLVLAQNAKRDEVDEENVTDTDAQAIRDDHSWMF